MLILNLRVFAVVVLCICWTCAFADVVIQRNSGLRVPFGRSKFLDPNEDLSITYLEQDRCQVTVLRSDPLSQSIGFLISDSDPFPCNFGRRSLQYTHLGSRFQTYDFIKLQIRWDSKNETRFIPIIVHITIVFTEMEFLRTNRDLIVSRPGGVSTAINSDTLAFNYDSDTQSCKISLLDYKNLPRYGKLINITIEEIFSPAQMECSQFLKSDVRYKHFRTNSSNRDYIPMSIEVADQVTSKLSREYFQIIVRILGAKSNQQPQASFQASNTIEVNQFVLAPITSSILAAFDVETPSEQVIFNVTRPLGSGEGSLVSTDDPYQPLTAFYQRDIKDLKIAYRPPASPKNRTRMFQMVLEAVDTESATSEPIHLLIAVKPSNVEEPLVTRNTGISLLEGQSRVISSSVLQISDSNGINNVRLQAIGGLKHGELRILENVIDTFMATDLEHGVIVYHHDGSETHSDNIVFRLSDDRHSIDFLFPIIIGTIDDQAPTLIYNAGLKLDEGGLAMIDPHKLSATDIDSDYSTVRFKLINFNSQNKKVGIICLRQRVAPVDQRGWVRGDDGVFEKNVTEFYQYDIMTGKVFYRHLGEEIFRDEINFLLLDSATPPNVSPQHIFIVSINMIDDLPPRVCVDSQLSMVADELRLTIITKEMLQFTDDDSKDEKLQYMISRGPYYKDNPASLQDTGTIVLAESQLQVVGFTQLKVNHQKIGYKAPNLEIGLVPRHIQFEFSVSDPSGNIIRKQIFNILLRPVDNKAPVVVTKQLQVSELGTAIIDENHLNVSDVDTPLNKLSVVLLRPPRYGALRLKGTKIHRRGNFSIDDVRASRVTYQHTTSGESSDELVVMVGDGVQSTRRRFIIVIKKAPIVQNNLMYNVTLEVKERSQKAIKMDVSAENTNVTSSIKLHLARPPRVGTIVTKGVLHRKISVHDLEMGRVMYQHTGGETGVQGDVDHFKFILANLSNTWVMAGKFYSGIDVTARILPVDSQPPLVMIQSPLSVLEGGRAVLSPRHFNVTDPDTHEKDILCTVDVQPSLGLLENISPSPGSEKSNVGKRIMSFTVKDIRDGNIRYVQTDHFGNEPRIDWIALSCSDGVNTSPRFLFNVRIVPQNDETPRVYTREFVVREGGELLIDVTLLNAVDADFPPEELLFYVRDPPKHGAIVDRRLENDYTTLKRFTLTQIRKSMSIVYQHDNSETTSDTFVVLVTDGVHNVSRKVLVKILPVDDEEPRLQKNIGLELETVGETKFITSNLLRATDIDSPHGNLTFIVRFPPQAGFLQFLNSNGSLKNLTLWSRFTQEDLNARRILYTQNPLVLKQRDEIRLDVTDGINVLLDQVFRIFVKGFHHIPPTVISKGVHLRQGTRIVITTQLLTASDPDSSNQRLMYKVIKAPTKGRLENFDQPGVSVVNFTQLELAGNKISYLHTAADESFVDSFDFELTDGWSRVFRSFLVTLIDTDNRKPVLFCYGVSVREGESKLLTPFELRAEDQDTRPESLTFTMKHLPQHGQVLKSGLPVRSFSQQDINNNLISYSHDGTDTTHDSVSFIVKDRVHDNFYRFPDTQNATGKPCRMEIIIRPVDNRIPQVIVNKGTTDLQVLSDGKLGFVISSNFLKADDSDSDDATLRYILTSQPFNGFLARAPDVSRDKSITNFTQSEIDLGHLRYILNSGTEATSDAFGFSVVDPGGNILPNQYFSLTWCWVKFEKDRYQVNEGDGILTVTIRRFGFLGENSFVQMLVEGVSASREDFVHPSNNHVQFSSGRDHAVFNIHIKNDHKYEGNESLRLTLVSPRMAVIGQPDVAMVTITDLEDLPVVEIAHARYVAEEQDGKTSVVLKRRGDPQKALKVLCVTDSMGTSGWARGTSPTSVTSFSDYISRPMDKTSLVVFNKGELTKSCEIVIIDDSLYEEEEKIYVKLMPYLGSHVGPRYNETEVIIAPDTKDELKIFFEKARYSIDESKGALDVTLQRTGTDFSRASSVFIRSRQTDPVSAKAGEDYLPVTQAVYFPVGITRQMIRVHIVDDIGHPKLEGPETFELVLRTPINARVARPHKTRVTITDIRSDQPTVQFKTAFYQVKESDAVLHAVLVRTGDLSYRTSVTCYTRQNSAHVAKDFEERPKTAQSLVKFQPGDSTKRCSVVIINDDVSEGKESFRLVLGDTDENSCVGPVNETTVEIVDQEDRPVVQFSVSRLYLEEPVLSGQTIFARITVYKTGDPALHSRVRVYSVDGSAKAGKDYDPINKVLTFSGNTSSHLLKVKLLHNTNRQIRQAFSLRLTTEENDATVLGRRKLVIFIEKARWFGTVAFPLPPQVVSLRQYDDVTKASTELAQGYPAICVTACDPKFSRYAETGSICASQQIDNLRTEYRWQTAATDSDVFTNISPDTFFADVNRVTLDSTFFVPGSRLRCIARAVSASTGAGTESISTEVKISKTDGICRSRGQMQAGAEPFVANIKFTGARDDGKTNMVHIKIQIPHTDGLIPVITTKKVSDFKQILGKGVLRFAQYKCSNLLSEKETITKFGFISSYSKNSRAMLEGRPYQFSPDLRGNSTLRLYTNLDLESCLWTFENFFHISELTQHCGGTIITNGQSRDIEKSQLTVRVPLFVSYVYRSVLQRQWVHYDYVTYLRLRLMYDTAVLLKDGVQTPDGSMLKGSLWLVSIGVRDTDKRLVVNFKTKTKFRGKFLLRKEGFKGASMVVSRDHPNLSFTLKLVRSEKTYQYPLQSWQIVSDYAMRDYTGTYYIKLLPCTATEKMTYAEPLACNPRDPISFSLPIRFQQINEPVPAQFTLSVQFLLLSDRNLWLTRDKKALLNKNLDTAFTQDSTIYGRIILVHNKSNAVQGCSAYRVTAEKIYLCAGADEYVPSYDPTKGKYGCLADSQHIVHRLKILDKEKPETVVKKFGFSSFNARFAGDDPSAKSLTQQPCSDGFTLSSTPLFKVPAGRKWFMHAIYSITPRKGKKNKSRKKRRKREAEYPDAKLFHFIGKESSSIENSYEYKMTSSQQSLLHLRHTHHLSRRSQDETKDIGNNGKGTNMKLIRLIYDSNSFELGADKSQTPGTATPRDTDLTKTELVNPLVIGISALCLILVGALIVVGVMYKRKSKNGHQQQPIETSATGVCSANCDGTPV